MAYKLHINNYLSATRKTQLAETDEAPAEKGHATKAKSGAPSGTPPSDAKPEGEKEGEGKVDKVADGVEVASKGSGTPVEAAAADARKTAEATAKAH
jgi:hypothetical protein